MKTIHPTVRRALVLACFLMPIGGVVHAHPNHAPAADTSVLEEARKDAAAWESKVSAAPADVRMLVALGDSWLKVARITTDHADFARAESAFRRVFESDRQSDWAPYGLAYALVGQHRFKEALEFARRAAFQHPEEEQTLALICDVHLALGNSIEARAIAQAMCDDKSLTLESLARLALAHQACGDMEAATTAMREALEAGTMLEAPARSLAWCRSMLGDFALEVGELEAAHAEHEAALLIDPACHHAKWQLARIHLREGEAQEARDDLRSLVASYPKPVYFVTLGDAEKAAGDESAAKKAYAEAESRMLHELDDKGLGHIRELAEFWLSHGGDAKKAAELALRDVNEVRQDFGAFDTAAWALFRAGRVSEAVPMALEAQTRNSGDVRSKCRAGIVLASGGRLVQGRQLIAAALTKTDALEPALVQEAEKVMAETEAAVRAGPGSGGGR